MASQDDDAAVNKWFLYNLFVFSAVAGSLFGYDTGVVSGSLVAVRAQFQMSDTAVEWFVSSTTLTAAFASLLSSALNDAFGRRPVLFLGAALCVGGSACLAFAQGVTTLILGRVLIGAAIGMVSATAPMYTSELAPPASRGFIVTLNDFSIVAGQVVAGLINVAFLYVEDGWRYAMGFCAVPALLMVAAQLPLPESPRWLYLNGQADAARASLAARRNDVDGTTGAAEDARLEFERMTQSLDGEKSGGGGSSPGGGGGFSGTLASLGALWGETPLRRAALLGLLLMGMNQLSGINTVMYYSASIFEATYGFETAVWLAAACDIAQLAGVLISLATIDRHGRRRTALRSCLCVALTLAGLVGSYVADFAGASTLSLVLTMAYLVSFGSGLSGVGWVVVAEIYPMRVRATAVSQAVFVNWLCNFAVAQTFLTSVHSISYAGTFGVYLCVAIVGGLLIHRYLPETNGVRLEEMEGLFQDPYPEGVGREVPTSRMPKEGSALLETRP